MRRKGSCRPSFRPRGRKSDRGEEKEGWLPLFLYVTWLINSIRRNICLVTGDRLEACELIPANSGDACIQTPGLVLRIYGISEALSMFSDIALGSARGASVLDGEDARSFAVTSFRTVYTELETSIFQQLAG